MSEFVNGIRIEDDLRGVIPGHQLDILLSSEEVLISGMPLLVVPAKLELPIITPKDSQLIDEEPVIVRRIFTKIIKPHGHLHIPEEFISEIGYPAVQCFTFTEDEMIFGIRESLQFSVRSPVENMQLQKGN